MDFIYKKMTSTQKEGLSKNKSAYLHFCSQERSKIKSEKPDIKSTDIVKVMGERWKALSEKDKEQYNVLAKVDKERYMSEKQAHLEQNPPVKKGKKKKEDKVVVVEAQPPSPPVEVEITTETVPEVEVVSKPEEKKVKKTNKYLNFCKAHRPILKAEKPDLQQKQVLTELSLIWKAMSEEEQAKYV